jgi:hypothetical protein
MAVSPPIVDDVPRAKCSVCGYPLATDHDASLAEQATWDEEDRNPEWVRSLCWSGQGCAHMGGYNHDRYKASRQHLS